MIRITLILFLLFGLNAAPALSLEKTAVKKAALSSKADYKPGELLVKYKSTVRADVTDTAIEQTGAKKIRTFKKTGIRLIKLPEGQSVENALEIYNNDPDVEYAEPNYRYHILATPDDPDFGSLWGLHNTGQTVDGTPGTNDADMDVPEAWDITTGSSDVVIAVIDTGVDYNHPDLETNIWTNPGETPGNGNDDDGNGKDDDVRGWDFIDGDNDPMDYNDHGTHVAGTIAAVGNNSAGISGVCWTASIMPVRALDTEGGGTIDKLILAIEYATENGADIINCSWGGSGFSNSLKNAIDVSPALFVCAAGNDGDNTDVLPHYPSAYTCENIISVAATDQDDTLTSFSNYGDETVDVAAPGVNIYSTMPARQTVWSDNFDDGSISDWTTGGTKDTWDASNKYSISGSYSLADSPAGDYLNNTASWARSPAFNLASLEGTKLTFWCTGTVEQGHDTLTLQLSHDGSTWNNVNQNITGDGNWWYFYEVDLKDYEGDSSVYMRFYFQSDSTTTDDGWFIDDVEVTAASSSYSGTEYQYMNGTSMATPNVSGIAGLLKAYMPSLTAENIKAAIECSVDKKTWLNSFVAKGGRVNAFASLDAATAVGTLQFASATYSVRENQGTATITVSRTNGISGAVTVDYATITGGTAAEGDDYTSVSGSLEWVDGDIENKTFGIVIIDDSTENSDKTVNLELSNAGGGAALGLSSAVLTIKDNDGGGSISDSSDSGGGGGGGGGCFIMSLMPMDTNNYNFLYN